MLKYNTMSWELKRELWCIKEIKFNQGELGKSVHVELKRGLKLNKEI